MAPVLGYWNIRGLCQPIRLLLAHAGVDYEDKRYKYGPPPTFDRSTWLDEKPKLGLDFPNLPYYIDGDVKITQSVAIIRYLARKHDLDGKTDAEKVRMDMMEQQQGDIKAGLVRISYNPDFEKLKEGFAKELPNNLKQLSDFLGKDKWVAGQRLTYVDFMLYECLDVMQFFDPKCLDKLPNLKEFITRFEALPAIQKYRSSDKFLRWPLNGDMASFGSKLQTPPERP